METEDIVRWAISGVVVIVPSGLWLLGILDEREAIRVGWIGVAIGIAAMMIYFSIKGMWEYHGSFKSC